jgi:hypothetical protein
LRAKEMSVATLARKTASRMKSRNTAIKAPDLPDLFSPRLRWREILIQSSSRPTAAAPMTTRTTNAPAAVKTAPVATWLAR